MKILKLSLEITLESQKINWNIGIFTKIIKKLKLRA